MMEIAHKLMSGQPGLLDKDGAPKPSLQGGMGKSPLLFSPSPLTSMLPSGCPRQIQIRLLFL